MISTEPRRNLASIRLGASFGRPEFTAWRYLINLAVTNVAMKVIQFTMGTARLRSDFATRKLLNTDAL